MTWRTHILFALVITVFIWDLLNLPFHPLLFLLVPLGALFPDLDGSESKIKHLRVPLYPTHKYTPYSFEPLAPIAQAFHTVFGHRGVLHSLIALIPLFIIGVFLERKWDVKIYYSIMFMTGYMTHLLGDSLTKSGVQFFYPWHKRIRLLPRKIAISTGTWGEEIVFILLMFLFILWFSHSDIYTDLTK